MVLLTDLLSLVYIRLLIAPHAQSHRYLPLLTTLKHSRPNLSFNSSSVTAPCIQRCSTNSSHHSHLCAHMLLNILIRHSPCFTANPYNTTLLTQEAQSRPLAQSEKLLSVKEGIIFLNFYTSNPCNDLPPAQIMSPRQQNIFTQSKVSLARTTLSCLTLYA